MWARGKTCSRLTLPRMMIIPPTRWNNHHPRQGETLMTANYNSPFMTTLTQTLRLPSQQTLFIRCRSVPKGFDLRSQSRAEK